MTFEQRLGLRRKLDHEWPLVSRMESSVTSSFFVQLFIFPMVLPTPHHGRQLDLAVTRNAMPMPNSLRNDSMKVSITRDGRAFYGTSAVPSEDLPELIREAVRKGAERKIYLQVDARTQYGDVEPVLDQIRQTRILNLAILVEKA